MNEGITIYANERRGGFSAVRGIHRDGFYHTHEYLCRVGDGFAWVDRFVVDRHTIATFDTIAEAQNAAEAKEATS